MKYVKQCTAILYLAYQHVTSQHYKTVILDLTHIPRHQGYRNVGVPRAPYITDWVQSSDFGVRTIPRHWDAEDFWCFSHAFVISRGFLEVLAPFFLYFILELYRYDATGSQNCRIPFFAETTSIYRVEGYRGCRCISSLAIAEAFLMAIDGLCTNHRHRDWDENEIFST